MPVKVLIVQNITAEGPGTIAEHLKQERIPFAIADLSISDQVPDLDDYTHLLVMGGPMAVYEMLRYPHLVHEALLIDQAIKTNRHVLGICLGAQMIAHVLGARVYAGSRKEIGWFDVTLTPDGLRDPLFGNLAVPGTDRAPVFQWHGDTFDLPEETVRLARSDAYPNQAFRFRDRVYALQFHIEVTPLIVGGWLKHEREIDLTGITSDSNREFTDYRARAEQFYRGFFSRTADPIRQGQALD